MAEGLKEIFKKYMEEAIGHENASVAFSALEEPASVSVRLNPFKVSPPLAEGAETVPWSPHGRYLTARPSFVLDPFFHGGAYYVQDSSSMFVGQMFRRILPLVAEGKSRPVRVLDLCAAPGGKTTDLAASLREAFGSGFVLVANEVVSQRASVLAHNAAIWGDPCIAVTSDDPSRFADMQGWFDIILADVPCSGEGMFRKDSLAREQWSEDNVRLCQGRQRRIAADVWPALAEGGVMIYSTCTFNRYENDDNVGWISDNLGAEIISRDLFPDGCPEGIMETGSGFSLVPGFVRGEGQYCAALLKTSGDGRITSVKPQKSRFSLLQGNAARQVAEYFTEEVSVAGREGFVKALPAEVFRELLDLEGRLHVLSSGCAVGEFKKNALVPDPDLALSVIFRKDSYPQAELDLDGTLSFLQGNSPVLKGFPPGVLTVCYRSLPLGFVKNLGNRCNSLFPRSRRIRLDI